MAWPPWTQDLHAEPSARRKSVMVCSVPVVDERSACSREECADGGEQCEVLSPHALEQRREDEADRPYQRGAESAGDDPPRSEHHAAEPGQETELAGAGRRNVEQLSRVMNR